MSGELGKQLRMSFYPTFYPTLDDARKPDMVTHYHVEPCKVGAAGFEPATSCSQSRRATELRHAPLCKGHNNLAPLCNCAKTGVCN